MGVLLQGMLPPGQLALFISGVIHADPGAVRS
jgi:hypothetical protein